MYHLTHHKYLGVPEYDADLPAGYERWLLKRGFLGRLTPPQKRLRFHRWQHFYLWPLYGANIIKWHVYDDFRDVILGRIGSQRMNL